MLWSIMFVLYSLNIQHLDLPNNDDINTVWFPFFLQRSLDFKFSQQREADDEDEGINEARNPQECCSMASIILAAKSR